MDENCSVDYNGNWCFWNNKNMAIFQKLGGKSKNQMYFTFSNYQFKKVKCLHLFDFWPIFQDMPISDFENIMQIAMAIFKTNFKTEILAVTCYPDIGALYIRFEKSVFLIARVCERSVICLKFFVTMDTKIRVPKFSLLSNNFKFKYFPMFPIFTILPTHLPKSQIWPCMKGIYDYH